MKQILSLAVVIAFATLANVSPAHASVATITPPLHAWMATAKMIPFSIRNASSSPIELRAGDSTMTVAQGQTLKLNLPVGTRVEVATATPTRQAGALVTEVATTLKNLTIVLN